MQVRNIEYCCQLDKLKMPVKDLIERIKTMESYIKEYALIIHDRDIYVEKNIQEYRNRNNGDEPPFDIGDLKPPHIHAMFRFKDSTPLEHFAKALGDERLNNYQKFKRGYKNAFLYLTHTNDLDKTQYNNDEVISSFDYATFKHNVLTHKTKNEIMKDNENMIYDFIMQGKIKRYNYTDYIDDDFYRRNKRKIDDTFKYRQDKLKRESKGERNMNVIYISGGAGVGKTTFAKNYCNDNNLSFYVSSSGKDILDGYGGEDVIILDDIRSDSFGLNDLFKLLDNNTDSLVASRFYNKSILECKLIIITSVMPIEDFYKIYENATNEPIEQLKRRCKTYFIMSDETIETFAYSESKRDYIKGPYMINPVSERVKKMSEEEIINNLINMFSSTTTFMSENKEDILNELKKRKIEEAFGKVKIED